MKQIQKLRLLGPTQVMEVVEEQIDTKACCLPKAAQSLPYTRGTRFRTLAACVGHAP